jgi:hypothetical protein
MDTAPSTTSGAIRCASKNGCTDRCAPAVPRAGQGGYGIQTAPAAADLAAALVRREPLPEALTGFDAACVAPGRF